MPGPASQARSDLGALPRQRAIKGSGKRERLSGTIVQVDPKFWEERWAQRQIGFHEGAPNSLLAKHVALLDGCRRVYVPLCGKAVDVSFLRSRGHDVSGSELVGTAISELFAENGLVDAVDEAAPFRRHRAERLLVLEGDAFAVEPAHLEGPVDAVYDRAALVALDPKTRERYVASLVRVLAPGATVLLVTFDYDQSKLDGPPWAVTDDAVETLYGSAFDVELVEEREASAGPKFAAAGVTSLRERLYALRSLTPRG